MATHSSIADLPERPSKRPVLLILLGFLMIGWIVFAVYLSSQKSAIIAKQKDLDASITILATQIDDLKKQNVEAAQLAKEWLNEIEKREIRWSRVLKALRELVPRDEKTQQTKVRFLSYSGSADGKLTLNVETIPAPQPPFGDVAQLLSVFNQSSFFKDAYVPSITRGLSETGNTVLSFIFNVTYLENADPNISLSPLDEKSVAPTSPPHQSPSPKP